MTSDRPDGLRMCRDELAGARREIEAKDRRIEELETEVKRMQSLAHDAIEYISPYLGNVLMIEHTKAYEALVNIRDGEDR